MKDYHKSDVKHGENNDFPESKYTLFFWATNPPKTEAYSCKYILHLGKSFGFYVHKFCSNLVVITK